MVVGLWQNLNQITLIDNSGITWASKIVAESLRIQYLPSCRGPGKCSLKDKKALLIMTNCEISAVKILNLIDFTMFEPAFSFLFSIFNAIYGRLLLFPVGQPIAFALLFFGHIFEIMTGYQLPIKIFFITFCFY